MGNLVGFWAKISKSQLDSGKKIKKPTKTPDFKGALVGFWAENTKSQLVSGKKIQKPTKTPYFKGNLVGFWAKISKSQLVSEKKIQKPTNIAIVIRNRIPLRAKFLNEVFYYAVYQLRLVCIGIVTGALYPFDRCS